MGLSPKKCYHNIEQKQNSEIEILGDLERSKLFIDNLADEKNSK